MSATARCTLLAASVLLALTGCVTPALDRGAFEQNAVRSLESAISAARTTELTITAYLAGKATTTYANTVLTESEDSMGPVEASFGTVQPPLPTEDSLRSSVLSVLGDVGDALADARIALRRHDLPQLRKAGHGLGELAATMEQKRDGLR